MGGNTIMHYLMDTATDLIAVVGRCTDDCDNRQYDISKNQENSKQATLASTKSTEQYGQTTLKGTMAKDEICFNLVNCFDIDFLLLEEITPAWH